MPAESGFYGLCVQRPLRSSTVPADSSSPMRRWLPWTQRVLAGRAEAMARQFLWCCWGCICVYSVVWCVSAGMSQCLHCATGPCLVCLQVRQPGIDCPAKQNAICRMLKSYSIRIACSKQSMGTTV